MDLSRFTVSGKNERLKEAALSNRRAINIRWFYVGVLGLGSSAASIVSTQRYDDAIQYLLIVGGVYALNVFFMAANKWGANSLRTLRLLMVAQLLIDLLAAVIVTYIQGGVMARTAILYAFPIVTAGLLFSRTVVYIAATLCSLAFITVIVLYDYMTLPTIGWERLAVPMVFYPLTFYLLARIVVHLTMIGRSDLRQKAYDSYLSFMVHQLKHPVSAASTIIDVMIADKSNDPTKTKQYIAMLRAENEDLIRAVDNLLLAARQKVVLVRESFMLSELVQATAEKTASIHKREGDLKLSLPAEPVGMEGDRYQLKLALVNLLDNAFRFSKEGAKVRVTLTASENQINLEIGDEGSGMDKHQLAKLYTKYHVREEREGADSVTGFGLGLHVADLITKAHGGTLKVQSQEGKGTKAQMTFDRKPQ